MKMVLALCAREDPGSSDFDRDQAIDEGIARAKRYAAWSFPARALPEPTISRFAGAALIVWSSDPVEWSLEGYARDARRVVDGVGYVDPSYRGVDAARADNLLEYSTSLGGCFNLFRASDHMIEGVTDATKSNSIFQGSSDRLWVLSSRALLAHMVVTERDYPSFDLTALSSFPTRGYIIGEGTPYLGISTVGIATQLTIGPRGVHAASMVPVAAPQQEFTADEWRGTVSNAADSLVGAFDMLSGTNINLALTGGRDSRIIAAALARHGGIGVLASTMGVPDDPDVILASEIAQICRWKHESRPPSRVSTSGSSILAEEPLDRITRILDVHDGMNSAWDDIEDYGEVNRTPTMSGVGGEILRGGLVLTSHSQMSPELAMREVRASLGNGAFVNPQYQSGYGDVYLGMIGESPYKAMDDFYYHERNGRWVASRRMGARCRRRVVDPLLDNRFIRATRQIDPQIRWEERLAFEMISSLHEPLRDLRLEGNRWRFERDQPHPQYVDGWGSRSALRSDTGIAQYNSKNLKDASMRRRIDEMILDGIATGPGAEFLDRGQVENYLTNGNKYPAVRWHLATIATMLSEPWFETLRPERKDTIEIVPLRDEPIQTPLSAPDSSPPKISVIIPMFNAERHVRESLESLVAQSFMDFEAIIVDDGSTDRSATIVDALVARDDRFRRVAGPASGSAGAARNVGLKEARGEYVTFLDADDQFAPSMLSKLCLKATEDDSDIVLTGFRTLHDVSGEQVEQTWALRSQLLPEHTPFAPDDLPDHLFYLTNPANWNKLFRRSFIDDVGITFQPLRRANDAFFTYFALASAKRISVVDETLVLYRIGNVASLQGTIAETPLEFVQALKALFEALCASGRYERHAKAFKNLVATMSLGALARAKTPDAFVSTYTVARDELFPEYGLTSDPSSTFLSPYIRRRVEELIEKPAAQWLFDRTEDPSGQPLKELVVAPHIEPGAFAEPELVDTAESAKEVSDGPDVSVIIPVYNSASWLHECLLSVLGQTGVSVEVICINDGSTDDSLRVLHEYATSDPRVVVIDRANAGPSATRNAGLAVAKGRYTCMIDSDDYWRSDQLAELVAQADRDHLDMLLFDAEAFFDAGVSEESHRAYSTYYDRGREYPLPVSGAQLMADLEQDRAYRPSPCLYIVRTEMMRSAGLSFLPGIVHEDNPFTFALLLSAKRAAHVKKTLYARRVRPGSIMTSGAAERSMQGYFVAYLEMAEYLSRNPVLPETSEAIGNILYRVLNQARRLFVELPNEVGDRVQGIDTRPSAHSLYLTLKHDRTQARKLSKPDHR